MQLRSLGKNSRHRSEIPKDAGLDTDQSYLRPDGAQYEVDARWSGGKSRRKDNADSHSMESGDSEQMIIRRNVEIQLHHEPV